MNHTRQPIPLLAALLALAFALPFAARSSAQPPPRPDPAAGGDGQPRIQMPRRAGSLGPARDRAAAPEVGTGRIRGRVVDDAGQAVRRVLVQTFGSQSRRPHMATTDADGRYELSALPAGTYQVAAMKGAFVRQSYGQRSRNGPGRPIELADGQSVEKIDFVLSRGGVIVGRVVDELGEPMAETHVQAMRFGSGAGSPRLMPSGRNATTDDLGQFRLYGLPPGEYIVSVQTTGNMMMFGPMEASAGDNSGYAPTYAPGTTSVADATRVQVQSGVEVNADIQLVAARMLRVTGTVVNSAGKSPDGGIVRLAPKGDVVVGGMGLGAPMLNGGFSFAQVPPGSYTLIVRVGGGDRGFRFGGGDGPDDSEVAMVPITVAGEDLANLRVVTSRGLTVSGLVTAEGGSLPTDQPLRVMVLPAEPETMMMGARPSTVEPNGRFQIEGVMGEGRVSLMGLGRGWMLKAVEYKGANVTDKPIEFSGDGGPLRVTITNRVPIVMGTATAGNGAPVTDYEVLIFTTDPSHWEKPGRTVRALRADQQGGFKVEGMPAGDYYIAAFVGLDEETRTSPETLERARGVAQQITLVEGQTRSLALKLSAMPQQ